MTDQIRIDYVNGKKIVYVAQRGGDHDETVMKAMEIAQQTGAEYVDSRVARNWRGEVWGGMVRETIDADQRVINDYRQQARNAESPTERRRCEEKAVEREYTMEFHQKLLADAERDRTA